MGGHCRGCWLRIHVGGLGSDGLASRGGAAEAGNFYQRVFLARARKLKWSSARTWSRALMTLDNLLPTHPRLLVTSLAQLRAAFSPAAAPSDSLRPRLLLHLSKLAAATLCDPPIAPGRDLNFHHSSRRALAVILHNAAAYFATDEDRFLRRAVAELEAACQLEHWNPSMFLDTAELALAVALGFDWLHDWLPPPLRATISTALVRNALALGPAIYTDAARGEGEEKAFSTHSVGWVNATHNWNQVCNSGMLCAALAVAGEAGVPPGLAELVVEGAVASLPRAMRSSYEPDGAFPESPQYWSFGTSYNVIALGALQSAVGSERGLVEGCPGLRATAAYRAHVEGPLGLSLTYGDNGQEEMNADPHLGWLATRFSLPHAAAHARAALEGLLTAAERKEVVKSKPKFDRLWPLPALWLPPPPPPPAPPPPSSPLTLNSAALQSSHSSAAPGETNGPSGWG